MSWRGAYRLALSLLPAGLRRKHGAAMESLFERELDRARAGGPLRTALVAVASVLDVVRRGAYERVRARPNRASDRRDDRPLPATPELLHRHVVSFTAAFVPLTGIFLGLFARRQLPELNARGLPVLVLVKVLLLAVPFIVPLTIPVAVLIAVLFEFTRLGAEGTLAAARRGRGRLWRLTAPVFAAAAVLGSLMLVEITEVVPRANTALVSIMTGHSGAPNARTMTLGELRKAARAVQSESEPDVAAEFDVEIQKRFALPAACLVMALLGVAIALRAPRGGARLVIGASCLAVFAYYRVFMTGEILALRHVVPPSAGIWGANVLLLGIALAAWKRHGPPEGRTIPHHG